MKGKQKMRMFRGKTIFLWPKNGFPPHPLSKKAIGDESVLLNGQCTRLVKAIMEYYLVKLGRIKSTWLYSNQFSGDCGRGF